MRRREEEVELRNEIVAIETLRVVRTLLVLTPYPDAERIDGITVLIRVTAIFHGVGIDTGVAFGTPFTHQEESLIRHAENIAYCSSPFK
jgi:hypothetical protein